MIIFIVVELMMVALKPKSIIICKLAYAYNPRKKGLIFIYPEIFKGLVKVKTKVSLLSELTKV